VLRGGRPQLRSLHLLLGALMRSVPCSPPRDRKQQHRHPGILLAHNEPGASRCRQLSEAGWHWMDW